MKKLFFCVRCFNLRDESQDFNSNEIKSIMIARSLGVANFSIEDEVCVPCRKGIGDVTADTILKIRNNERKRFYPKTTT